VTRIINVSPNDLLAPSISGVERCWLLDPELLSDIALHYATLVKWQWLVSWLPKPGTILWQSLGLYSLTSVLLQLCEWLASDPMVH